MKRIYLLSTIFLWILILSLASLFSTKNLLTIKAQALSQSIIITEIGAHEPSNLEWIEIFNNTDSDIDITNLKFVENGVNHSVTSENFELTLPANSYAVIANKPDELILEYGLDSTNLIFDSSWSSLNLSGETLALSIDEQILDQVTYPEFTSNTSLEKAGETWIHHPDSNSILTQNFNVNNDQEICTENEDSRDETTIIEYKEYPTLLISEVSFKDTENDWIEIYIDPKEEQLQLSEYFIQIDNKQIALGQDSLTEPSLLIIEEALVGTTEQILLNNSEQIFDTVCWQNDSPTSSEAQEIQELIDNNHWQEDCINSDEIDKNQSIGRSNFFTDLNNSTDWSVFPRPTKSELNQINNQPPQAKITTQSGKTIDEEKITLNLDGSESSDPDNDNLTFEWDFNNGETSDKENPTSVSFTEIGTYQITLTVSDFYNYKSTATLYIEVLEKTESVSAQNSQATEASISQSTEDNSLKLQSSSDFEDGNIILHSFLPNPEGSDEGLEWIKLQNIDNKTINLKNWVLDDSENSGSKPYVIPDLELAPQEIHLFYDSETQIVLNNSSDTVRLLKGNNELKEQINYTDAKDNEVFTKDQASGQWSQNKPNQVASVTTDTKPSSTSKKSTKKSIPNGTKNNQIQITEIFPNPKGTDTGQEWIELYNPTNTETNLSNWTLKSNSKEHTFEQTKLPGNSYTKIQLDKFNLANGQTSIILSDFEENIISQTNYEKAEEGKSYVKINEDWQWMSIQTPGQPNPEIIQISGTITNFDLESQTLTINDQKVLFDSKNLSNEVDIESQYKATLEVLKHNDQLLLTQFISIEKIIEPNKEFPEEIALVIILATIAIPAYIFRDKLKNLMTNFAS